MLHIYVLCSLAVALIIPVCESTYPLVEQQAPAEGDQGLFPLSLFFDWKTKKATITANTTISANKGTTIAINF